MEMLSVCTYSQPMPQAPAQADNDAQVIGLWLHGKAAKTQNEYRRDIGQFLAHVGKPLQRITLADVQDFKDSLAGYAERTQGRKLAAAKSLMSFAQKIGYLLLNPGAAVKAPKVKNDLAERILSEEETLRMIALESGVRDHALLRFMYATGCRASEVCRLSWRDFSPRPEGSCVVTIFGKGSKTRFVTIPAGIWRELQALKASDSGSDNPVFRSRNKGGHLSPAQVFRVVQRAARRAGIERNVSPHWMRHACASHSLDRGAPIHVVQATLGHENLATTGKYTHIRPTDSAGMYLAIQ